MTEGKQPAAVFDCMVYFQAAARPSGPAAAAFRFFEEGRFCLFVTEATMDEVRDVLSRPEIRRKNPLLTDEGVVAFLARISAKAELLHDVPEQLAYPRDPDDEP